MSLRSPLSRVLGLGAAGDGPAHWYAQRVSAVALALLGLWLLISLLTTDLSSHAALVDWLASPFSAVLMLLLVITACYHALLGLQVVIEDYSAGGTRLVGLLLAKYLLIIVGGIGVLAVLRIALGG